MMHKAKVAPPLTTNQVTSYSEHTFTVGTSNNNKWERLIVGIMCLSVEKQKKMCWVKAL